ncbi:MAG: hypothetical protein K2L02_02660 [Clostridia bacterium]|nr:hypothetical protein [Clostridia bacterium]
MKKFSFLLLLTGLVPLLSACKSKPDYFSYVSELRSDLFTASEEEFSLTVACISREYPYNSDGIKAPLSDIVEITLEGDADEYSVYILGEEHMGGEMSFRNTRGDFYFSQGVKSFPEGSVTLRVEWEDTSREIVATSVKTENTLSPEEALDCALNNEKATLERMSQSGSFEGEFYVRLLRRDKNYYYVGIVDTNGKMISLLLDSESGELLARHE